MVPSSPDVATGQANAQCSQKLALGMLDTPGDGLLSTPTALATACNRDSEGGLSLSQVPVAFTTERSETYEFFAVGKACLHLAGAHSRALRWAPAAGLEVERIGRAFSLCGSGLCAGIRCGVALLALRQRCL